MPPPLYLPGGTKSVRTRQTGSPGIGLRLPAFAAAPPWPKRCRETATILLFRRLRGTGPGDLPKAALTAAVLAHVRADVSGVSVARHVGPSNLETPETALLKPLRFRRLMETVGWDERLTAFRRLAALAGASLPVQDLARALLFWNDESRRRWVLDYWNAVPPPAPAEPAKDATP